MLTQINNLNIIELLALGMWLVSLLILIISLIMSIIFYRRTKSSYALGLIVLCLGFIIGRIFRIMVKYLLGDPIVDIPSFGALIAVNLVFWPLIGMIFAWSAFSLTSKKLKQHSFTFFWIILEFTVIIIGYIAVYLIESNIGDVPDIKPYYGLNLLFENIALIATWFGFISLFYCVEKSSMDLFTVQKPTHFFSILTVFALIFTVIENYTGDATYVLIILFISSMAGMGSIFYYIVSNSTGTIRRNAVLVLMGHLLLVFSFAFEIPSGYFLFSILPEILLLLGAPLFQILGLILYTSGIFPTKFKK